MRSLTADDLMKATLTITAGPDIGRICDLEAGCIVTIGRSPTCDFRLSDQGVSRVHCRVVADRESVNLEDLGSRYGTLVNERAIEVRSLRSGDTIALGDTTIQFSLESASQETMPPSRLVTPSPEWLPEESVTYDVEPSSHQPMGDGEAADFVGRTFVHFDVEALVARSASGVVYRAMDTLHHRPVALKMFWPNLFVDDVAMSRFLRSMRAMVPLKHPHLIRLYAAGRSTGLCFTANEFIEGESVSQIIERIGIAGMLDWRTTWRIAVGLTEALSHLHGQQILHRSLQPSNILVRREDQCVKLGDSLLAKSLDQLGQLALTARGDIVGNIHYLPPEQLSENATVDHRADIYSLGATLYALLVGRPPFVGTPAETVRQILTTPPVPPKTLHLSIPAAFEGIVLRMLAKRPVDRFPNMESVANELHRLGRYEGLPPLTEESVR